MSSITDVACRQDFVLLFDVTDGNPNGDPDAGNLPRVDPETMHGLVTDIAVKRKVRDFVDAAHGTEQRNKIYVQHGQFLSDTRERVFKERGGSEKRTSQNAETWMCDEFFDVRMFGAVLPSKGSDSGQVRGPIQLTFARSIDPITPLEMAIVGPAQNKEQSRRKEDTDETEGNTGTMGRKAFVPYGLYRTHGFFNPHFATKTGATSEDLGLFWDALQRMWDLDRSATRGELACRGLYVFSHDSHLGNAPAHKLFERITVVKNEDVLAARKFTDYVVNVDGDELPTGVTLTTVVA